MESAAVSDDLAERLITAVSEIQEIKDGIADDLIDTPRVTFAASDKKYGPKARKIMDLRDL